jgi:hypothetical protein
VHGPGRQQVVADDVRLSMPPMLTWFDGRAAVAAFVEAEIFARARRRGVPMRAGWCNGQPAFATYQPGEQGRLTASGLQVLELADRDGRPRITAIVSFRSRPWRPAAACPPGSAERPGAAPRPGRADLRGNGRKGKRMAIGAAGLLT